MTKFITKALRDADFDKLFASMGDRAIVINDLPYETKEERDYLNKLVFTTYESTDPLPPTPTCLCGRTKGGDHLGERCPRCNGLVERPVERAIGFDLWVRCPEGVRGFIQPKAYIQLSEKLSPGNYNLMDWLCDPRLAVPDNVSKTTLDRMRTLNSYGWQRGINYLIDNFLQFIELLPALGVKDCENLQMALRIAYPNLFPKHLPFPSKILLVLEKVNSGYFTNIAITPVIDAARAIATAENKKRATNVASMERLAALIVRNLSSYAVDTGKTAYRRKKGWFRGQLYGSRANFSSRGVVTSIYEPHYYGTLHIPWEAGVEVYKYHIINILVNRHGFSEESAYAKVESCGRVYDPLLDSVLAYLENTSPPVDVILKEIKDRFPCRGLPCTWQRNPTLPRNSSQFLRAYVKRDVTDQTFSMSPCTLNGPNADFDGDEMNHRGIMDIKTIERAQLLEPHYAIHDLTRPGKFNNSAALPDVALTTISNFVSRSLTREKSR